MVGRPAWTFVAGVVALTLCGTLAHAQSGDGGSGIEEIVVTARKRAESLENAPISVTALSAQRLDAMQVRDVADIQHFVPNLSIRRGRSGTDANVYIRGIGTQGDEVFTDQAVGIYVDGVYLPRTAGSIIDLLDFEQIEVLRGPQGTLFGKNTVGGAIKFSTIKPHDEFEGKVRVTAGNFDYVQTRATLNIPLGYGWLEDKLFSRFSFGSTNTDGYTTNTLTGVNWNDEDTLNFLGAVRFLPTENVTVDLTGTWYRNHGSGRGGNCVLQRRSQFDGLPGGVPEEYYDYCQNVDPLTPFDFRADSVGLNDQRSYGTWGTVQWDVGDVWIAEEMSFKLIGSWREQIQRLREDIDMSEYPIFQWSSTNRGAPFQGDEGVANQQTVELQQNVEFWDGRISLVNGAFFYWEHVSTEFDYLVFPESPLSAAAGGLTKSAIITDNFSWAVFMHGVIDFTDWMQVTAGVRYTNEKKGAARSLTNLALCESGASAPCTPDDPNDFIAGFPERSESFDQVTPTFTLSLTMPEDWLDDTFIDHTMTYFTYSQGFKGGGINAAIRTMDPREIGEFDQEILNSFELGLKSTAWDRRVQLSLAGYYGLYDDLQLPTVVGGTCPPDDPGCIPPPLFIIDNAAEAEIAGAELEILASPIDGLSINASAAYTFAEYKDYPDGTNVLIDPNQEDATIDRSGERFPFVPRFSSTVGVQYGIDVDGGDHDWLTGTVTPRLDWSYRSSVQYWGRELTGNVQSGYNLLNGRLGFWFLDDTLELALWSRNMTDETYFDEVYNIPALVVGNITRFYAEPRTFGGEINFRF